MFWTRADNFFYKYISLTGIYKGFIKHQDQKPKQYQLITDFHVL